VLHVRVLGSGDKAVGYVGSRQGSHGGADWRLVRAAAGGQPHLPRAQVGVHISYVVFDSSLLQIAVRRSNPNCWHGGIGIDNSRTM
jgi:hypothetical protein